jgi:hypothetical protein
MWKKRALLYGLLILGAVLVLTQKPSEAELVHPHELNGRTAQGAKVRVDLDDRHVTTFSVAWISTRCHRTVSWSPAVTQRNVRLRETGEGFSVHEWSGAANFWMRGRLSGDGRRMDGTITYSEKACASGPISFTAER